MKALTYRGTPYELSIVGDINEETLTLECWDMSPSGGLLFRLKRDSNGDLMLEPSGAAIPINLIKEAAEVAGLEMP